VWAPSGFKLAYATDKTGLKTIFSLDTSNSKAKPVALFQIHAQDMNLAWSAPNQILFFEKGSAYIKSSAWLLDITKKTLSAVAIDTLGLDVALPQSTSSAAFGLVFSSQSSRRGGTLSVSDNIGGATKLGTLTLPSKCGFYTITTEPSSTTGGATTSTKTTSTKTSSKTALAAPSKITTPFAACGVPADFNSVNTAMLPDDYFKKSLFTVDTLYGINLKTGDLQEIISGTEAGLSFDASRIKIFGNRVFFINRFDQKVYGVLFPKS